MIRLLVIVLIAYLAFRVVRGWISSGSGASRVEGTEVDRIDDVMVKDPYCGSYFPRRDGIPLQHDGRELLFCSQDCRDKFKADNR